VGLDHRCWVEISLPAFSHNVNQAKQTLAGEALLMVAVKSDAYGHGQDVLAPLALKQGADALAVLDIATGLALRPLVGDARMLCWLLSPQNDFTLAIENSLELGVSHRWQLEHIRDAKATVPARVHLKIDTGLSRNGALPKDWPALVQLAASLESDGVLKVVGIWSHLADASVEDDRVALERFHQAVAEARTGGLTPTTLHIAASAAASAVPEARLDMVRIGVIIYGVTPFDAVTAQDLGFVPVMIAQARVLEVDLSHKTFRMGMGFADGLLPLPPETGWVLINGERASILEVGSETTKVSFPTTPPAVGDVATLWGDPGNGSPLVEDWALWGNTIGDEVVAGILQSVPKVYLTDD